MNTASIPHSQLNKLHNALEYHKTWSSIAAHILCFINIRRVSNPDDDLSKHWDYNSMKDVLQPTLFSQGDTVNAASFLEQGPLAYLGNEGSDNGPLLPTTDGPALDS